MPSLLRLSILLTVLLALALPARAAEILAASVAVDATAQSAAQAKEQALKDGQHQAFRRLLESITVDADHGRLPAPANWQDWVVDFSVDQEKTSAVRYLAILTVRFRAQPVRTLLRQAGIPFAETASKPVLVVPVFYRSGRWILWDDDNLWLKAWQDRPQLSGLVPVLAPQGDNWDRQAYDAGADKDRLNGLARRYGAVQALVAEAKPGANGLDVRLIYPGGQVTALAVQVSDSAMVYRQAADRAVLAVEEGWKRANLLAHESAGVLLVTVGFNGMADWLKIRDRLDHIPMIRRQETIELARNQASLALYHAGSIDQLRTALAQADLVLSTNDQGVNALTLAPNAQR